MLLNAGKLGSGVPPYEFWSGNSWLKLVQIDLASEKCGEMGSRKRKERHEAGPGSMIKERALVHVYAKVPTIDSSTPRSKSRPRGSSDHAGRIIVYGLSGSAENERHA